MAGIKPVSGGLTMDGLAATLNRREQLDMEQITALAIDPTQTRNLVTTVDQTQQLGTISIYAAGATQAGTIIISTTAYISGVETLIELYRSA